MKTIHGFPLEQIYREAHLARLGATSAEFQKNPQGTLEKYGQHDAIAIMRLGLRPLLPAQVHLRQTLLSQWRAEGTWNDSMLLHPVSSNAMSRFTQRIRQAMDTWLGAVKQHMPFTKRHHMSHRMT